jgi:hypothetical protein
MLLQRPQSWGAWITACTQQTTAQIIIIPASAIRASWSQSPVVTVRRTWSRAWARCEPKRVVVQAKRVSAMFPRRCRAQAALPCSFAAPLPRGCSRRSFSAAGVGTHQSVPAPDACILFAGKKTRGPWLLVLRLGSLFFFSSCARFRHGARVIRRPGSVGGARLEACLFLLSTMCWLPGLGLGVWCCRVALVDAEGPCFGPTGLLSCRLSANCHVFSDVGYQSLAHQVSDRRRACALVGSPSFQRGSSRH